MKIVLHLVFFLGFLSCQLFAADPEKSVATDESAALSSLEEYCRKHGYDLGPAISTVHAAKNRENIKRFIGKFSGGRLLILGVGPSHDVPLKWLLERFDHITLIDGDLKPVKELLERLADKDPSIKNKVELVPEDLSGGIFKLMKNNTEGFQSAVAKDYCDGDGIGNNAPFTEEFLMNWM